MRGNHCHVCNVSYGHGERKANRPGIVKKVVFGILIYLDLLLEALFVEDKDDALLNLLLCWL